MNLLKFIWHIPRNLSIKLIEGYQKTISPDHSQMGKILFPGGHCKFTPSCSMYSKEAFKKYGFVRGVFKTIWRILRCNPWSKGGQDLA